MNVFVTKDGCTTLHNVDFSIGDIVKITNYGSRAANQASCARDALFPTGGTVNLDEVIVRTEYRKCNELYHSIWWKIVDVGFLKSNTPRSNGSVVLRLMNRTKGELIFIYDPRDSKHDIALVRKSKKQIDNYSINFY